MRYEVKGHKDEVLKVNKALYGLKQAQEHGVITLMAIS
jgi:hypothetical protein